VRIGEEITQLFQRFRIVVYTIFHEPWRNLPSRPSHAAWNVVVYGETIAKALPDADRRSTAMWLIQSF